MSALLLLFLAQTDPGARKDALDHLRRDPEVYLACTCMETLAGNADVEGMKYLFAFVRRSRANRLVYGARLEHVLPYARDPEARKWVVDHGLRQRDAYARIATARALGFWRTGAKELRDAADVQLRKTRGRDEALLYEAARALGRIGGAEATEILFRCAKDDDWRARIVAAEFKTTIDLVKDPNPRVRAAALGKPFEGRAVYVLDVSEPMGEGVPARINLAVPHLVAALPKKRPFTLMTFAGHVATWPGEGAPAEWIRERARPRGGTNTWEALSRALDEPDVGDVYLYTGSHPTTGKYAHELEVAAIVKDRNRFARVRIHVRALHVEGNRPPDIFLRGLAVDSHGTYERIPP